MTCLQGRSARIQFSRLKRRGGKIRGPESPPGKAGAFRYYRTTLAENTNFSMFPLAVTICLNSMMVVTPPGLPLEELCFAHAETDPRAEGDESDPYGVGSVVAGGAYVSPPVERGVSLPGVAEVSGEAGNMMFELDMRFSHRSWPWSAPAAGKRIMPARTIPGTRRFQNLSSTNFSPPTSVGSGPGIHACPISGALVKSRAPCRTLTILPPPEKDTNNGYIYPLNPGVICTGPPFQQSSPWQKTFIS